MKIAPKVVSALVLFIPFLMCAPTAAADEPRFSLELEVGPAWQSDNTVQIPNDPMGTRFSLEELVGSGPWAAGMRPPSLQGRIHGVSRQAIHALRPVFTLK